MGRAGGRCAPTPPPPGAARPPLTAPFLPSLFMPVVNLEKIPSFPKPEGLKAAHKTPPKAPPAPPASSPAEPPGRPSPAPPPPPKEPPGAGGDSVPAPTASPVLKAGEKEPGVCRPPPRAHKKLTRESSSAAGGGEGGYCSGVGNGAGNRVPPCPKVGCVPNGTARGGGGSAHSAGPHCGALGGLWSLGGYDPWGDEVLEGLQ